MCSESENIMWGICDVCTLALTVAKTSSHYDRIAIFVPTTFLLLFDFASHDRNIRGPKSPGALEEMGHIRGQKTLFFENARFQKTLTRSRFLRPFYFNLSDRMHIRANSIDPNAHRPFSIGLHEEK